MDTDACLRQPEPWFFSLAILGALYVAAFACRLFHISGLALCLCQPKDLRRSYGAWAVVTGPTSGIGRSMAVELARRGLNLVLVGRDPAALQDVSDTVSSAHGVLTKTVQFDFSLVSTPQGDEAMGRLREAVAGLEVGVLVNNAGVAKPGAVYLHEADAEAWVRMVRVNLWAMTEVTAAVLPGMVERGRGAIVNIGSGAAEALPSYPLYSVYGASKQYVAQFSRSLYVEYTGKGIDVQCQAPLYVDTKMVVSMVTWGGYVSQVVMPTPDAYAGAAARCIGHRYPFCLPNLGHRLQMCFNQFVPGRILVVLCFRETLQQRAMHLPRS
ncbi:very-long-chain 3-oxoacyl-CoA reductase 1 [Aegilops tauschii subsp. strangulata]|nr:very-long-chain 3-oxoacyl-CoA reductase 1 [Aegilops tauschii subsp. strangulata]